MTSAGLCNSNSGQLPSIGVLPDTSNVVDDQTGPLDELGPRPALRVGTTAERVAFTGGLRLRAHDLPAKAAPCDQGRKSPLTFMRFVALLYSTPAIGRRTQHKRDGIMFGNELYAARLRSRREAVLKRTQAFDRGRSRWGLSRKFRAISAIAALIGLFATSLVSGLGANAAPTGVGNGFVVTAGDLSFILKQIKIAERHAATQTPADLCGTLVGPDVDQIPDRLSSYGLRTVDGSCNNLFAGREKFAAADVPFPRFSTPDFRDAEPITASFPVGPVGPTSYKQKLDRQHRHRLAATHGQQPGRRSDLDQPGGRRRRGVPGARPGLGISRARSGPDPTANPLRRCPLAARRRIRRCSFPM